MKKRGKGYGLSDKGSIHVINFLKQRITTVEAKIQTKEPTVRPKQHVQK